MSEYYSELKAIRVTIDLYIDGVHNGDVDMLRNAFHPKAMMYGVSDKAVTIVGIEGLFDFVAANTPISKTGEKHECLITHIHYAGNAANVEMTEESAYVNDYTNYFQLLKIEGKWSIVSKTYNATPSKT